MQETDFSLFSFRAKQGEKCGKHGAGEEVGNNHPRSGNHAKFGETDVIRRREGKETQSCGQGSERQGWADLRPCPNQRRQQMTQGVTLGAIANRILNLEIDAETYKQRNKRNRNEV